MADINSTIEFLTPYFTTVEDVIGIASLFVGGIFGIYLVALIVRFIFLKKVFNSYSDIKESLSRLETKIDSLSKEKGTKNRKVYKGK